MIGIRERRYGSWLDPASAVVLGCKMGHLLWKRCVGQRGLFLTLTYDRSKYRDALDLYRTQSERKHVAKFMSRLSRTLGRSLKGKWVRKMEFQEGGWVHWHLIIVGLEFVPNAVISQCWGHGFTKTKGLNKGRVFYLTKYVAKGGVPLPSFIWGERPRSVKIIAASPGFWGDAARPSTYCAIYAKYGPKPPSRWPAYVPIGKCMERNRGCTMAKGGPKRKPFGIHSVCCEPVELIQLMAEFGRRCVRANGWLWFDVDEDIAAKAAAVCGREWSQRLADCTPAPRSGALNLRGTSKRSREGELPPHLDWLDAWWKEQAMAEWLPGAAA